MSVTEFPKSRGRGKSILTAEEGLMKKVKVRLVSYYSHF